MYLNLNRIGANHAPTDDKKYSCPSIPYSTHFMPYRSFIPDYKDPMLDSVNHQASVSHIKVLPQEEQDANDINYRPIELYNKSLPIEPYKSPPIIEYDDTQHSKDNHLLPVLDCRFNLREICKQSILLEDHLSHDKKRCFDCCIKHFLALEGLSEEAITLDKEAEHLEDLKDIPNKIREIQKFWFKDPQNNSHKASQMLREIRKKYMQNTFDIVFNQDKVSKDNMCGGGLCKIKS